MHTSGVDQLLSNSRSDAAGSTDEELEEILDDPHCRHLLEYLRCEDDPVPVAALARHVVAQITDTTPESVDDDVQHRVQTWLHHGQLPVLDEYGIVEFDADSGEVALGQDDLPAQV